MKKVVVVYLTLFLLLITSSAHASMSIQGATGLIKIPTAHTQRINTLGVGYHYHGGQNNFIFNYGYNQEVEFGLTYAPPAGLEEMKAHLKTRVLRENHPWPALAVGVTEKSVYAVGSKTFFPLDLRVHLGYGSGVMGGIFAGLEKPLNPISITQGRYHLPITTAKVEYMNRNVNLGMDVEITPQIRVKGFLLSFKELILGMEVSHSF